MAKDDSDIDSRAVERAFTGSIAVFEGADSAHRRTRKAVQELGYRLALESTPEAIERRGHGDMPSEIVIVGMPEGQELVATLRSASRPPVVIASLPGPPATAHKRFAEHDAELYAVRPHSADSLGPVLHAAGMLAQSKRRIAALKSSESRIRERLQEAGHSGAVTGFQHFEFFKKLLVLEIKRAKRYKYSIAVCLVAPDAFDEVVPSRELREELSGKLAEVVTSCIRDIDLPVDYAEERMLLFLPYTNEAGALEVGERVAKMVRSQVHGEELGERVGMTVSIGIAALREGAEVSFAKLMRDANAALKAAQLKGGNQVVCR